jgi:hypothetical protein
MQKLKELCYLFKECKVFSNLKQVYFGKLNSKLEQELASILHPMIEIKDPSVKFDPLFKQNNEIEILDEGK